MKRIYSRIFPYLPIFFILLFAFFLRSIALSTVPVGISDDELGFVLNAKSVAYTGSNISGAWSPFHFPANPNEFPQSETLYTLLIPFIAPFHFSFFLARLPFVISNIILIYVIYALLSRYLSKRWGLVVAFLFAINPWNIMFARTSFEAPVSVMFLFLSLIMLTRLSRWKMLWATIPLFLAFTTYMGTKILFIPFVIGLLAYSFFAVYRKKYLVQHIIIGLFSLLLFGSFIVLLPNMGISKRNNELATINSTAIKTQVDEERKDVVTNPFSPIFSNKYIIYSRTIIEKYFKTFSPDFLFTNGEARSTFSLHSHGYFYYIDALFILFGCIGLFLKKRSFFTVLFYFLLLAPLPVVANQLDNGFAALRGVLLFPVLTIFSGCGIAYMYEVISRRMKPYYVILVISIYTVSFLNFGYIYFFRNPIVNAEAYSYSRRVLTKYLSLADNQKQKTIVIAGNPRDIFQHFLFESDSYTKQNAMMIRQQFQHQQYSFGSIQFISCDTPFEKDGQTTYIIEAGSVCEQKLLDLFPSHVSISQLADGGEILKISHDTICTPYALNRYPSKIRWGQIYVEHLDQQDFCQTYINRL